MQIELFTPPASDYSSFRCLQRYWSAIRREYFPERPDLDEYLVSWSPRRQKRVLAVCNVQRRRVVVAQELDDPRYHQWLSPILYHEMCHAFFGKDVPKVNGRRAWHGRAFRELEGRHLQIQALNEWIRSGGWLSAVRSHRARSRTVGRGMVNSGTVNRNTVRRRTEYRGILRRAIDRFGA
ncbi:MAG: SprT-like domain-containing protein [Deltaproteobacteria bacterium]|nr:SprT-like domain-containing protein [Deltaproteobacteria bacterium]